MRVIYEMKKDQSGFILANSDLGVVLVVGGCVCWELSAGEVVCVLVVFQKPFECQKFPNWMHCRYPSTGHRLKGN